MSRSPQISTAAGGVTGIGLAEGRRLRVLTGHGVAGSPRPARQVPAACRRTTGRAPHRRSRAYPAAPRAATSELPRVCRVNVEVLAAIGLAVLVGVGCIALQIVGEAATEEAKDSARRPSFAMRRQRHRGLLKTGGICGVLAFGSGFRWLVVATSRASASLAHRGMRLASWVGPPAGFRRPTRQSLGPSTARGMSTVHAINVE